MNDFQTFHLAMVALRLRRRWSQQKAGSAAGLDHSTVSRWESGSREPTRKTLQTYLEALGASEAEQLLIMNAFGGNARVDARALTMIDVMADTRISQEHRDALDQILDVGAQYARAAVEGWAQPAGHPEGTRGRDPYPDHVLVARGGS